MNKATQLPLFDFEPTKSPTQQLSDILEFLDSIWSINSGGCGVSALAIYRWCKQREEISDRPFVFLWREYDEWEAQHNDDCLENGDLESVEIPAHVVIELYDGLYDSQGEADYEIFPIQQAYRLNESELLYVINEHRNGWNTAFSRNRHIPEIESALGIDLSDVIR